MAQTSCSEVFFSEYVEGSSNNKSLEIFNGTGSSIDLTSGNYQILFYFNGNTTPGTTISLNGTIVHNGVFVVSDRDADLAILNETDQTASNNFFNGNDAIELRKNGITIDVIGQIGFDPGPGPGTEWGTGLTSTRDNTLRRKMSVVSGDSNGGDAFDPSVEWDGFARDDFSGLGSHNGSCVANGSEIPTLGEWGIILLFLVILIVGCVSIRPASVRQSKYKL